MRDIFSGEKKKTQSLIFLPARSTLITLGEKQLCSPLCLISVLFCCCLLFFSWNKLLGSILSKWSACIFKYNRVALLNSVIIVINCSSQRTKRWNSRDSDAVPSHGLYVLQSHPTPFVLVRELCLSLNENGSSGPNKFGSWWTQGKTPGSQRLLSLCVFSAFCVGRSVLTRKPKADILRQTCRMLACA